jgi:hypothetical protein
MFDSILPIKSVSNCKISGAAFSFVSALFSSSASLRPEVLAGPDCKISRSSTVCCVAVSIVLPAAAEPGLNGELCP